MCGWRFIGSLAMPFASSTIRWTVLSARAPPRSVSNTYGPVRALWSFLEVAQLVAVHCVGGRLAALQALHQHRAGIKVELVP